MMADYLVRKVKEEKNSDKSTTVIAEVVPYDYEFKKGDYNEEKKFMQAYKFWLPEKGIKDFNAFFELTFPNFSKYINQKYGRIEITPKWIDSSLINDFPMQIANRERHDSYYFTLEMAKGGKAFGNILIHYRRVNDTRIEYGKICDQFNEFKYIPSMKPEIPDSDFFNIMKHEMMQETYRVNFKQKIDKKVILNEKEFHDALDIKVNDLLENESWRKDHSGDSIISQKNPKREFSHFIWDFWAGWGHGTTIKAFSCHRCSDSEYCKDNLRSNWHHENAINGIYTYESLKIKIPFP
jgi:hypothetical protein